MRIRLRDDAYAAFCRQALKGRRPDGPGLFPAEHRFADMLKKVQGQWLEVETDHLFDDQYNTPPVPGVSELGLRVMDHSVAEIEGDVRPRATKCWYCGKTRLDDFANAEKPCGCKEGVRKLFLPKRADSPLAIYLWAIACGPAHPEYNHARTVERHKAGLEPIGPDKPLADAWDALVKAIGEDAARFHVKAYLAEPYKLPGSRRDR